MDEMEKFVKIISENFSRNEWKKYVLIKATGRLSERFELASLEVNLLRRWKIKSVKTSEIKYYKNIDYKENRQKCFKL